MECIGPTTAAEFSKALHLSDRDIQATFLRLEAQGHVLRDSSGRLDNWTYNMNIDHSDEAAA